MDPFFSLYQKVLILEANDHLLTRRLPCPDDLEQQNQPLIVHVSISIEIPQFAKTIAEGNVSKLYAQYSGREKAKLVAAQQEVKHLTGKVDKLKTEVAEYKLEAKEGYKARDEKSVEYDLLLEELKRMKVENEELREKAEAKAREFISSFDFARY
jgi:hypothetical protein